MKKEQLTALGISEELATKVLDLHKEELQGFIPKHRFDEVNTAKTTLETQLSDAQTKIKELSKFEGDNEALKNKLATLQTTLQDKENEYKTNLKNIAKRNLTITALMNAAKKPYDANMVCDLLDLSKIEVSEDNSKIVAGFQEQYENLAKEKAFLFGAGQGDPNPKGNEPGDGDPLPKGEQELSDFGKRLALKTLKSRGISVKEEK